MDKKEEKKFKLSKENATAEFNKIVEEFNFNVSTELKSSIMSMKLNGVEYSAQQEFVTADSFIQKIMQGRIKYDEENRQIVYVLKEPVKGSDAETVKEFRFGKFTRAIQKSTKVPLNECNFQTMKDDQQDSVIMAMTGVSDEAVFGNLEISEFNDLRMIAGYFFN
jgi:hypothetical protein